jgi:Lar family restriction alleviation protein
MAELKPCPFCGGDAYCASGLSPHADVRCIVTCEDCNIRTPLKMTKEEAIEAWNWRAEE